MSGIYSYYSLTLSTLLWDERFHSELQLTIDKYQTHFRRVIQGYHVSKTSTFIYFLQFVVALEFHCAYRYFRGRTIRSDIYSLEMFKRTCAYKDRVSFCDNCEFMIDSIICYPYHLATITMVYYENEGQTNNLMNKNLVSLITH